MKIPDAPFGIVFDEVVTIRTSDGPGVHPYRHADRTAIIAKLSDVNQVVSIDDANGHHNYPVRSIISVHFSLIRNETNAAVQLWQGKYGLGPLYIVDPYAPQTAYQLRPAQVSRWTAASTEMNFAALAAGLISGHYRLDQISDPRPIDETDRAEHAATWRHGNTITIEREHREEHPGDPDTHSYLVPVAGPETIKFIGDTDMARAQGY